MLFEYARLIGNHPSIKRYRQAIEDPTAKSIHQHYIDNLNARYDTLDEADRRSIYHHETARAKAYVALEQEIRNKMYSEIAQKCIKTVSAEDSGKARKTRRKKGTSSLFL